MWVKAKRFSGQRGSMLLETAMVVPILIIILAGIIQFGFILNAKVAVNAASYEAARAATLSADPRSKAIQAAGDYASGSIPGWSYDERLKVQVALTGTEPFDTVDVTVIYSVPVFFEKILPAGISGQDGLIDVKGSSTMRLEERS